MKLLKSLSPFILLLIIGVISFRFLFFVSYIQIQKSNFREQVIIKNSNEAILLKFSVADIYIDKNGFEWKDNNKELVVNGTYYEIISITKLNDNFVVKIITDKAENELFQNYFNLNKNSNADYADFINLLLSFTYISNGELHQIEPVAISVINKIQEEFQFIDFYYNLKQIKPPQFA